MNIDDLKSEKEALRRAGSLHWIHWAIVILSLLLTLSAWYITKQQVDEKLALKFQRETQQVIGQVRERMQKYGDALWAGVAFVQNIKGEVDYPTWTEYAKQIDIAAKYPGINGIGIIYQVSPKNKAAYIKEQQRYRPNFHIHPLHKQPELLPITFITPQQGNAKAVGLDMAHEKNRYRAMIKARNTGKPQITAPITLVQDKQKTPGFLFYAPFYTKHQSLRPKHHKSEAFIGAVYAPFIMTKLLAGTLSKKNREVSFDIFDQSITLYSEHEQGNPYYDPNPMFDKKIKVPMYGRVWTFDFWSTKSFKINNHSNQPIIILIAGIVIDALLLSLFILLTRSNRRAIKFANRSTESLILKAQQLETSNRELEQFATAASHDLQEPLRKIHSFCSLLTKRFAHLIPEEGRNYIERMQACAVRMQALMADLLVFSKLSTQVHHHREQVNLNQVVSAALGDLDERIESSNAKVTVGDLFVVRGDAGQLQSLLQNLIGNAIKYCSPEKVPEVNIFSEKTLHHNKLIIRDNGIGFDMQYKDKIFELFQRLHGKQQYSGSGVGLALCKKIAAYHNATIDVQSTPGIGATFIITFPVDSKNEGENNDV